MSRQSEKIAFPYYVSLWLPAAVLMVLLILVLIIQVALSWRAHTQLIPVNRHVTQMTRLQGANLELQRELIESLNEKGTFTRQERDRLRDELAEIMAMRANLSPDTPAALAAAHAVLKDAGIHPKEALILALSHLRRSLDQEAIAHRRLIDEINRATSLEVEIGSVALLVFPLIVILLIYLLRRRILLPLNHLGYLMTLLARNRYSAAPLETVGPLLRPLTANFNKMVTRLEELEREHVLREQDLKSQVENATWQLLEQQRSLANTERLAAVGETMARIAHELRNPLAGVKLACTNLRQDLGQMVESQEYQERIDIVAGEVDRIISLLNSLLEQSRHKPEPPRDVNLAATVAALVVLARYQMPAHIQIEQRIADDLVCQLPEALLRQALLNLLLNASQAIGERPGTIVVEAAQADGRLQLTVRDDGPGFPADLIERDIRIFVTHRAEGTGLGLSMVQRFARSLGGSISLSNQEPCGACVTLDLPCGKDNHA
ncbi:MAG: ATP-binding protein [Gammaproteobacteria bacterium]